MSTTLPQAPLPRYRCHKLVHAAKIVSTEWITLEHPPAMRLDLEVPGGDNQPRHAAVFVSASWVDRNKPVSGNSLVGGYFVRYEDGYESWSPAAQFESGYTLEPA